MDWVPSARKQMEMNARDGFPRKSCFSLDWMLFECHRLAEKLKFSTESREKLQQEYGKMVDEEVSRRKIMREKGVEEELFNEKKLKFFDVQCGVCRNYIYLSVLGCRQCQALSCLSCHKTCCCTPAKQVMFVRATDRELLNY